MKKIKNIFISMILLLSGLTGAGLSTVVHAEEETPTITVNTIDKTKKGSITLYKLRSEDGKSQEGTAIVQDISQVATDGIPDVIFKYWKVGELVQLTSREGNSTNTQNYYTLNNDFVKAMKDCGSPLTNLTVNNKTVYTTEVLNDAMEVLNTRAVAYDNDNDGTSSGNERMTEFVKEKGSYFPATNSYGKTKVTGLDLGLYMIAEVSSPAAGAADTAANTRQTIARPAIPFLVSIPMTNIAKIGEAEAGTVWQYDITAYPKNEMLSIRKDIIADGNDLDKGNAQDTPVETDDSGKVVVQKTDKNIGDYVNFLLTLDVPVLQPQTTGKSLTTDVRNPKANKNRKYIVTDTLTDGLTLDSFGADNIKATFGTAPWNDTTGTNITLAWGSDYTVRPIGPAGNAHGFVLTMTEEGLKKFDAISHDSRLFVNYKARLNKDMVEDKTDAIKVEGNTMTLKYGTNVSADREFYSNKDIKIYSYEIDMQKKFSKEVPDASAVQFSVTAKDIQTNGHDNGQQPVKFIKEATDGVYHVYDGKESGTPIDFVSVSKEGLLVLKGLDARTYILTEENTVAGFNLMRDKITITLRKSYPEDGTLEYASVQSGDNEPVELTKGLETGTVKFAISNNETITMLRTGGEGWGTAIKFIGASVFTCGLIAVLYSKKNKENNK